MPHSMTNHFPWHLVPFYILAQISGASLASFLLRVIFGVNEQLGVTQPAAGSAQSPMAGF